MLFLQFLPSCSPPSPPQGAGKQFKVMSSIKIFVSCHSHGALCESCTHMLLLNHQNLIIRSFLPTSSSSSSIIFQLGLLLFLHKTSKIQRRWKNRGNKAAAVFHWWKQRQKGEKEKRTAVRTDAKWYYTFYLYPVSSIPLKHGCHSSLSEVNGLLIN